MHATNLTSFHPSSTWNNQNVSNFEREIVSLLLVLKNQNLSVIVLLLLCANEAYNNFKAKHWLRKSHVPVFETWLSEQAGP